MPHPIGLYHIARYWLPCSLAGHCRTRGDPNDPKEGLHVQPIDEQDGMNNNAEAQDDTNEVLEVSAAHSPGSHG